MIRMSDDNRNIPTDRKRDSDMTATEVLNAKHPPLPGQAMLEWMIEREMQLLKLPLPSFAQALADATDKLRDKPKRIDAI
jgi:hypothetical protein